MADSSKQFRPDQECRDLKSEDFTRFNSNIHPLNMQPHLLEILVSLSKDLKRLGQPSLNTIKATLAYYTQTKMVSAVINSFFNKK